MGGETNHLEWCYNTLIKYKETAERKKQEITQAILFPEEEKEREKKQLTKEQTAFKKIYLYYQKIYMESVNEGYLTLKLKSNSKFINPFIVKSIRKHEYLKRALEETLPELPEHGELLLRPGKTQKTLTNLAENLIKNIIKYEELKDKPKKLKEQNVIHEKIMLDYKTLNEDTTSKVSEKVIEALLMSQQNFPELKGEEKAELKKAA